MSPPPVRIAILGVDTSHAQAFTDILRRQGPAAQLDPVDGAEIVAVWGEPAERRHAIASRAAAEEHPDDPAELAGHIDLALVLQQADHGARHRELAEPLLAAGIPVFVDKPMAPTVAAARALFDLAAKHSTPLASSSALRFAAELTQERARIEALGEIRSAAVTGSGDWFDYGIHAVELLLAATNVPVDWVNRHNAGAQDVAVLGASGDRHASVLIDRDAHGAFTLTLHGRNGWLSLEVTRMWDFYRNQLQAAVEMARTGRAFVPAAETLQVLAVLEAGERSLRTGRPVRLAEVLS